MESTERQDTARQLLGGFAMVMVMLLAVVLRFTSAHDTVVDRPIRGDAKDYVGYAYNWKNNDIYSRQVTWVPSHRPAQTSPDALRPPGYPAFLMPFLTKTPDWAFVRSVMWAQACIGIVIVLMTFLLARALLGLPAAVFASFVVAISPHLIVMENYLLTETLYTLLVLSTLCVGVLAVRAQDSASHIVWAGLAGIAVALCCLVRPTLDQMPLVLVAITWAVPALKRYRKASLCALAAFFVVMAPWWIRNLTEFGHINDNSLMIQTLHHGSYPGFMYHDDPRTLGYPYESDPQSHIADASLANVLHYIAHKFSEHPLKLLGWYMFGKIGFFFSWQMISGFGDIFTYQELQTPYYSNQLFRITHSLMFGLHWPLVFAGLLGSILVWTKAAGLILTGWRLRGMRWLALVLFYAIAVHMVGAPFPRYSIPFRPQLYLLAAFSVVLFVKWLKVRRLLFYK